eukprot:TRINITY_DN16294_c0_g1_i1.p1 TRINITY_DN16294_c0_g1~~TRINITY_DN16294_c0_g1_i1.p1  ORF type:complete len:542 (-),score=113.56 TRINITY_DN16294_c0_g1_i1:186-1811(-)
MIDSKNHFSHATSPTKASTSKQPLGRSALNHAAYISRMLGCPKGKIPKIVVGDKRFSLLDSSDCEPIKERLQNNEKMSSPANKIVTSLRKRVNRESSFSNDGITYQILNPTTEPCAEEDIIDDSQSSSKSKKRRKKNMATTSKPAPQDSSNDDRSISKTNHQNSRSRYHDDTDHDRNKKAEREKQEEGQIRMTSPIAQRHKSSATSVTPNRIFENSRSNNNNNSPIKSREKIGLHWTPSSPPSFNSPTKTSPMKSPRVSRSEIRPSSKTGIVDDSNIKSNIEPLVVDVASVQRDSPPQVSSRKMKLVYESSNPSLKKANNTSEDPHDQKEQDFLRSSSSSSATSISYQNDSPEVQACETLAGRQQGWDLSPTLSVTSPSVASPSFSALPFTSSGDLPNDQTRTAVPSNSADIGTSVLPTSIPVFSPFLTPSLSLEDVHQKEIQSQKNSRERYSVIAPLPISTPLFSPAPNALNDIANQDEKVITETNDDSIDKLIEMTNLLEEKEKMEKMLQEKTRNEAYLRDRIRQLTEHLRKYCPNVFL